MSGFQTRNTSGSVVVDSDYIVQTAVDYRDYIYLNDYGAYNIPNKIGSTETLGSVNGAYDMRDGSNVYWFRINNGSMLATGDLYSQNAGRMVRTRRDNGIDSGYLDVFNASGALVWSAVHANKVPRVIGFYDIPAGYDLANNVYSQNIGLNSFILFSGTPGFMTQDGSSGGPVAWWSTLILKMTNGVLQSQFVSNNGPYTWANTFQAIGLRIPYAVFPIIQ